MKGLLKSKVGESGLIEPSKKELSCLKADSGIPYCFGHFQDDLTCMVCPRGYRSLVVQRDIDQFVKGIQTSSSFRESFQRSTKLEVINPLVERALKSVRSALKLADILFFCPLNTDYVQNLFRDNPNLRIWDQKTVLEKRKEYLQKLLNNCNEK
jgi:hypothetical protein